MDFKWEDPPSQTRPGRVNPEEALVADRLRTRPGHFARVFVLEESTKASQLATNIKQGKRAAFRASDDGHFDALSRRGVVYVRFMRN